VVNFKSALKSLLVKSDITPSSSANCVELVDGSDTGSILLACSAKRKATTDLSDVDADVPDTDPDGGNFQLELELSKPIQDIVQYISKWISVTDHSVTVFNCT
jgi:hypothetical protein